MIRLTDRESAQSLGRIAQGRTAWHERRGTAHHGVDRKSSSAGKIAVTSRRARVQGEGVRRNVASLTDNLFGRRLSRLTQSRAKWIGIDGEHTVRFHITPALSVIKRESTVPPMVIPLAAVAAVLQRFRPNLRG